MGQPAGSSSEVAQSLNFVSLHWAKQMPKRRTGVCCKDSYKSIMFEQTQDVPFKKTLLTLFVGEI